MELLVIVAAIVVISLSVILILETYQYSRILRVAKHLDNQDDNYRTLIYELGTTVNNNADILKEQATTIAELSANVANLELASSIHGELFKLVSLSTNLKGDK